MLAALSYKYILSLKKQTAVGIMLNLMLQNSNKLGTFLCVEMILEASPKEDGVSYCFILLAGLSW